MFFWNIEALKDYIRNNKLTELNRFVYLICMIIPTAIIIELQYLQPNEGTSGWDEYAYSIYSVVILMIASIYAYKLNGGIDGQDFLGRYFSICFVLTIRFTVLTIAIVFILVAFLTASGLMAMESIEAFLANNLYFAVWQVICYWRICHHIADLRAPEALA